MLVEKMLLLMLCLAAVCMIMLIIILARLFRKDKDQEIIRRLEFLTESLNKQDRTLREEMLANRTETGQQVQVLGGLVVERMAENAGWQKNQLKEFTHQVSILIQSSEQRLDNVRQTVEDRLKFLQDDNSRKLEQIRLTVDEKLHSTLEQRLGESFKLVSERLEMVHKGLGEMQNLATGVGDLKKVLTNVKSRGIWGEIQLGNILQEVLSSDQYAANVAVKTNSLERVEYAVRLPGRGDSPGTVWLPIDAKFPQEDYLRLVDATEEGNQVAANQASVQIENRIKAEARNIASKYIDPPHTTDFAIMFLPTESLFAEVIRRPGLLEYLQREYRVNVAGPTTMAALLNSLAVGFRTLAIEKRSSEVWNLLGAVKTEFGRFGDLLDKTQKKLQEASSTIENAARRSRTIERKLGKVQELPAGEAACQIDSSEELQEWGEDDR
ncbi:MAG: DNA recombination protein RmuC [Chitinophagales bacterium]